MTVDNQFVIATANLLNFALPNRVFYRNQDGYTPKQYQQKINALAPIFRQLQADIIGCQEIWDEQALIDLCHAAGLNDYHVTVPLASNQPDSPLTQGQGAVGTPSVGLVSRFEIINTQLLTQMPAIALLDVPDVGLYQQFNRPPLIADIRLPNGMLVTVIVAHLKSKRPEFLENAQGEPLEDRNDPLIRVRAKLRSLCMRAAEAAGIRQVVIEKLSHNNHPLILLGDMNDVMQSVTCQLLSESGEVFYDKSMRDIVLYDASTVQSRMHWLKDVAYTHIHQGMPEVLDQILVSEQFLADSKFNIGEVLQVDYFNDHLKFIVEQRPTDHGLVRAQIKLYS
ncbi:endonuclease/exonuclease/phosphatase family protein [Moraxella osloensis]|nr:endonuclease/exonuclease/phosphatase family protein [Moraxella osloensis]MCK6051559.1 endonuclease/exonuclease/phosphatase family protein [Moraxella osloensis]